MPAVAAAPLATSAGCGLLSTAAASAAAKSSGAPLSWMAAEAAAEASTAVGARTAPSLCPGSCNASPAPCRVSATVAAMCRNSHCSACWRSWAGEVLRATLLLLPLPESFLSRASLPDWPLPGLPAAASLPAPREPPKVAAAAAAALAAASLMHSSASTRQHSACRPQDCPSKWTCSAAFSRSTRSEADNAERASLLPASCRTRPKRSWEGCRPASGKDRM